MKRKGENDIYPKCDPDIENPYAKVSLAREMQFQNLKSHTPLYITPYAIANYIQNYSLNFDSTSIQKTTSFLQRKKYFKNESLDKLFSNIGLDIKIGLTKNSTLDLTLNTDFSQAEVDNRIINLSKYDVNLPEKRSFFLESDDYFNFTLANKNELFISRSIGNENGETVPIIAGVRLTGIIRDIQTGILTMQTVGIDDVEIKPHNFFALRNEKRFDIRGSYIGSIFTKRINMGSDNSTSNQTIGFDWVKRINPLITLSGYAVATPTNFNFKSFAQISSFAIALSKHTRQGIFYDTHLNFIGADFMPVMGYIDETDYAEAHLQFGYQWIAKEKSSIQYYYFITDNRYRLKSLSGKLETFSTDLRPGLFFKNQAEIVFSVFEYKIDSISYNWQLDGANAIAVGTYKMFKNSITAQFPRISNYNAMLNASYGDFYGGKRFYISPIITWHANKHLTFDIIYEYNHIQFKKYLDEERNTLYQSNLIRLGFSYLMSIKFSAKLFTQYDDLTRTVGSNLRFRYNPSSGTDLYIVFNQEANTNRKRLEPKLPLVNSQGVTIKFIKSFGK